MQIKKMISVLTIFLVNMLFMFGGPSDKHFLNGEKWVPKDFDPKNSTLLIENFSLINKKGKDLFAKENQKLKEFMKENYPYPYEFTSNLDDPKYSKSDKYRYAITWGTHTSTPTPGARGNSYAGSSGMTISSTGITCSLYDVKNNTDLPASGKSTSYASGIFSMTINTMVYIFLQRDK